MDVIEEFRGFLTAYLRGKTTAEKRSLPWKETWQFVVAHSNRVEAYAVELIEAVGTVTETEALLIRAAALMHDIGSLDDRRNHPKTGARIASDFCNNKPHILEVINPKILASMISGHRKKDGKEKKLPLAILKDADILDELGAMSVLVASYEVDPSAPNYYARVLKQIEKNEFGFFRKQEARLSTPAARKILRRKFAFIKDFAMNLREELKGTDNLKLQ